MAERRKKGLTEGPRERRKEDRRKDDEKTSHVRRKLSDRRTTYNLGIDFPGDKTLNIFSNRLGQPLNEIDTGLREDREILRRNGNIDWTRNSGRHDEAKKPFINLIRPKIKSRKGGLLGLGIAVSSALIEGKEAYDRSKEKK